MTPPSTERARQIVAAMGDRRRVIIAANALAARIFPVHTPFDGDVIFALSTSPEAHEMDPVELLRLGAAAQTALEEAITRSVRDLPA